MSITSTVPPLKTITIDGKEYICSSVTSDGVIKLSPVVLGSSPSVVAPVVTPSVATPVVVEQPPPIPPPSASLTYVSSSGMPVVMPYQESRKKRYVGVAVVEETIKTKNLHVALRGKVYDYIATKACGWRASNGIIFRAGTSVTNEFRDGTNTFFLSMETFRNKRVNINDIPIFGGKSVVPKHADEIAEAFLELNEEFLKNKNKAVHDSVFFEGFPAMK